MRANMQGAASDRGTYICGIMSTNLNLGRGNDDRRERPVKIYKNETAVDSIRSRSSRGGDALLGPTAGQDHTMRQFMGC